MAEGDRAAVDVDLVLLDAEHPQRVERDGGERLVDLPEVDVARATCRSSPAPAARPSPGSSPGTGSRRRPCRRRGPWRAASRPFACAHSSEATTTAPAPSLTPGALPAVWVASSPPIALQLRRATSTVVSGRIASSAATSVSALRALDRDRRRSPRRGGPRRSPWRRAGASGRPSGPCRARVISSSFETSVASLIICLLGERVGEPVVGHRVDRVDVAHAEAEAGAGQQVRSVRHRLHAAGDADLELAGADRLGRRGRSRACPRRRPC